MNKFDIREIHPDESGLLEDFLYHAIYLPPGTAPPPRDVVFQPELYIYIDGFGDRPGDCGAIAEIENKIAGAAWTRIIPAYGHIDDNTPELAIAVLPEYRGQGVGTAMLTRLFELLRRRGYKRTSLSVQKANPAVRLYQRVRYKVFRENEEDWIMVKNLVETETHGLDADKLHTTPLGSERIKGNLGLHTDEVVDWCKQAVRNARSDSIQRIGKNWYVYGDGYVLTINAYSHTIITAHKHAKNK